MKVNGRGGNLTPATQKPLNRWSPKFVYVTMSGISTTMQNFIQIVLGVSVLRMRDFAPLVTRLLFWGFLRKATAETRAPILTQNMSNDVVPRKQVPFGGRETKNLRFRHSFSQKTAIFGPHFDGTRPKTALTLDRSRVNDH